MILWIESLRMKWRIYTKRPIQLKLRRINSLNLEFLFFPRVWYLASGDKFWLNAGPRQQLGFRDYLPGRDNGISAAVTQLNEDMRTKPIAGTFSSQYFALTWRRYLRNPPVSTSMTSQFKLFWENHRWSTQMVLPSPQIMVPKNETQAKKVLKTIF